MKKYGPEPREDEAGRKLTDEEDYSDVDDPYYPEVKPSGDEAEQSQQESSDSGTSDSDIPDSRVVVLDASNFQTETSST